MIAVSNIDGPATAPPRRSGCLLLASVDVEWTKNYRIRNGNIPFCYSVVYLDVPTQPRRPRDLAKARFSYTSVYVESSDETQTFIELADAELRAVLNAADRIVGHQLSSDLAVLTNAATAKHAAITAARDAWHARQARPLLDRGVIDTRYDVDPILSCQSRRLVDVCTDIGLDVTQPELRGSMTAMHRRWLDTQDTESRERIAVLNLRHSLSAALVAVRATRRGRWDDVLNVNRILHTGLAGQFTWLTHPTFTALL